MNLEFHKNKFENEHKYYTKGIFDDYEKTSKEFIEKTKTTLKENNKKIVNGEKPEFFDEFLKKIIEIKSETIEFSVVY